MDKEEMLMDLETIKEKEFRDLNVSKDNKTWVFNKIEKRLEYPNAEILLNWLNNLPSGGDEENLKGLALNIIKKGVQSEEYISKYNGTIRSTSQLFFYCLIKLDLINEALEELEKRNSLRIAHKESFRVVEEKNNSNLLFRLIQDGFDEFVSYMNKKQIHKLYHVIEDMNLISHTEQYLLSDKLINLRFDLLEKSINKTNIEINRDKAQLMKLISNWGFNEEYNDLLENIERYILSDDKHINSGMVGNLRSFLANFVIEIATKISRYEEGQIPHEEGRQKVGDCRSYLKSKLNLSDEEDGFLNHFIKILHSEGGHSFYSNKEYFRLARNIAVEIGLFLMSKAVKKYPEIRG